MGQRFARGHAEAVIIVFIGFWICLLGRVLRGVGCFLWIFLQKILVVVLDNNYKLFAEKLSNSVDEFELLG